MSAITSITCTDIELFFYGKQIGIEHAQFQITNNTLLSNLVLTSFYE